MYSENEDDPDYELPTTDDDDDNVEEDVESGSEYDISEIESIARELTEDICGRSWKRIAEKRAPQASVANIIRGKTSCLTKKSRNISSMKKAFDLFISKDIMNIIIDCTNKKAEDYLSVWNDEHEEKIEWENVDAIEIEAFLGLLIISGRFRESKESPKYLWNKNSAFGRNIYLAAMSRKRFTDILKFIRFDDLSTRAVRKEGDKLAALRQVTEIFTKNCRESYNASECGTIDEQLVSFKGRCPFRVYMPTKPGKYGIKLWALCDAKTYYCCNLEVYCGKTGEGPEVNQGPRVVNSLSYFWNGSGRNITTANFFTSIKLAEELLEKKLTLVGTIRKNKNDLPKSLVDIKKRAVHSSEFLFTKNVTLVSYVTKRNKFVVLLSSMHSTHEISDQQNNFEPEIIMYYNSTKSGVDTLDKLVREYKCRRATRRWPFTLFMNYVDIATYNAFVIWKTKYPEWTGNVCVNERRKIFLQQLAVELLEPYIKRRAERIQMDQRGFNTIIITAIEAFGIKIKKTEPKEKPITKRGRCYGCKNDNKYSKRCNTCERFVCPKHCRTQNMTVCAYCSKDEDGE